MSKKTTADQFYNLAEQYVQEGRFDEAIILYEKLLAMNPENGPLLMALAWVYKDNGQVKEAVECLEQLLEKEFTEKIFSGFAYDELVRIFREQKDYTKLISLCERVVDAFPDEQTFQITLGEAYLKAGANDRAVEVFEILVRNEPDDPLLYCNLGAAHIACGKCDDGERAYEQAVILEPLEAHSLYYKCGYNMMQEGFPDRAERFFRKSLQVNNNKSPVYCDLGDVLIELGRIEDAEGVYEKASKLVPESRGAFYNRLGNTLMRQGYYGHATNAYQKAVDEDPDNPFYRLSLAEAYKIVSDG